ncbi:methyltransferase [Qipengyuania spongiae]|uniref:Class I SAM-dependent methyltransferase n=1 Tax=Qipengyuania spongiae TaxID=2909673 RepID=A0ABY5SWA7_9SPHN|nr:methyltransferase [Qipengyuania spongiae]UVI38828.1 class I SAM-dependent methyltransferase [Qipengyuania spongiae]
MRRTRCDPADWFVEAMVEDVRERIGFMRLEPGSALVEGIGAERIVPDLPDGCETTVAMLAGKTELVPSAYDLVISLGQLDTINDLPGQLLRLRFALAPGGILLAVIPGAGSLPRLRHVMIAADSDRAFPRIHPQIDNRAATMLLERAGFARQVVDGFGLTVRYGSLDRLVGDLREQGLGSTLAQPGPPLGKQALARARAAFSSMADEDGKVSEHFELLALTAWNA